MYPQPPKASTQEFRILCVGLREVDGQAGGFLQPGLWFKPGML